MNCEEILDKYQLFLDGELDEEEIQSFKQHLNECQDCGQILRFERHFHMTITRKFRSRSAPDELMKKIRTKLF